MVCGGSLRKDSVIRYQVFEFPNFYVWVNVEVSLKIKDYMKELGLSILRVKRVMSNHAESSLDLILEGSSRMVNNRGGGVEGGAGVGGWASGRDGDYNVENKRRLTCQVSELQDKVRRKDEKISDLNRRLCYLMSMMIQQQRQQQQQWKHGIENNIRS